MSKILISGFSDEISDDFITQLETVTKLGMKHISIRGVDGKNFADYTIEELKTDIMPRLEKYGVKVSSIGSPIGKVFIDDNEGFEKQLVQLEKLCEMAQLLDTKYIRIFSFYIKEELNYDDFKDDVIEKIKQFAAIANKYDVVLLHENEKDIYGDIARRCKDIFDGVGSPSFRAVFDFANFVQVKQDTVEAYDMLQQYVEYIHIKDALFSETYNVECGTGDGNIEMLLQRFFEKGYNGFLTLEPHLAMFGTLKSLELEAASKVIKDLSIDGKTGYEMQYNALINILKNLEVTYG